MFFWNLFRVYICLEENGENCNHIEEGELSSRPTLLKSLSTKRYNQTSYRKCYTKEYIYLEENTENC